MWRQSSLSDFSSAENAKFEMLWKPTFHFAIPEDYEISNDPKKSLTDVVKDISWNDPRPDLSEAQWASNSKLILNYIFYPYRDATITDRSPFTDKELLHWAREHRFPWYLLHPRCVKALAGTVDNIKDVKKLFNGVWKMTVVRIALTHNINTPDGGTSTPALEIPPQRQITWTVGHKEAVQSLVATSTTDLLRNLPTLPDNPLLDDQNTYGADLDPNDVEQGDDDNGSNQGRINMIVHRALQLLATDIISFSYLLTAQTSLECDLAKNHDNFLNELVQRKYLPRLSKNQKLRMAQGHARVEAAKQGPIIAGVGEVTAL